jgi:hypothetical protein
MFAVFALLVLSLSATATATSDRKAALEDYQNELEVARDAYFDAAHAAMRECRAEAPEPEEAVAAEDNATADENATDENATDENATAENATADDDLTADDDATADLNGTEDLKTEAVSAAKCIRESLREIRAEWHDARDAARETYVERRDAARDA